MSSSKLFVVSGPSGSGKTTLVNKVLTHRSLKDLLKKSVSFTTREKRSSEVEGADYYFISKQEFELLRKRKKILEWTAYLGYYYGTAKEYIEAQFGKVCGLMLCLDIKGAKQIKKIYPKQTVTIFVLPPSIEVLADRIKNRCKKIQEKEILERVKLANKEIAQKGKFDYTLVNDDLDLATEQLKDIVIQELKK